MVLQVSLITQNPISTIRRLFRVTNFPLLRRQAVVTSPVLRGMPILCELLDCKSHLRDFKTENGTHTVADRNTAHETYLEHKMQKSISQTEYSVEYPLCTSHFRALELVVFDVSVGRNRVNCTVNMAECTCITQRLGKTNCFHEDYKTTYLCLIVSIMCLGKRYRLNQLQNYIYYTH